MLVFSPGLFLLFCALPSLTINLLEMTGIMALLVVVLCIHIVAFHGQ